MQEGSGDHTKKHKIWAERLMREPIFFYIFATKKKREVFSLQGRNQKGIRCKS